MNKKNTCSGNVRYSYLSIAVMGRKLIYSLHMMTRSIAEVPGSYSSNILLKAKLFNAY